MGLAKVFLEQSLLLVELLMNIFCLGQTIQCYKCGYESAGHSVKYVPTLLGPPIEQEEHFERTCLLCGFIWNESVHPSKKDEP